MQPSFLGVNSCAKFHVLSQLIVFLDLFYMCLQLVYFSLYILLSPCLLVILTSIQMLLVVCLDGILNDLELVLLNETK